MERWWAAGWGFDWLYDRLFVRPVVWFARANRADHVDFIYRGIAELTEFSYRELALTETGKLRWYAAAIVGGATLFVVVVILS